MILTSEPASVYAGRIDGYEEVDGARVEALGVSAEIIPPEGDAPECWLGPDGMELARRLEAAGVCWGDVVAALEYLAENPGEEVEVQPTST